MITLYKKTETRFVDNGLGDITNDVINPKISWMDNGMFSLSFQYLTSSNMAAFLTGQMLIKAPTPDGPQIFRICQINPNMGMLEITAYHLFYDLLDNLIEDTFIQNQSGAGAIVQLGDHTQYKTNFRFYSDIQTIANSRMVRLNPVTALLDPGQDNSFVNRWGGHIHRDNYTISMLAKLGNDHGVEIRHKKNLTGYNASIDWNAVVTRLMPKGFDGLLLPEKYVDSPRIGDYTHPKISIVEYPNIIAIKEDGFSQEEAVPLEEAYKLLREAAQREFDDNRFDYPIATYNVNFIELGTTEEYKDLRALERINPGDTITVIHEEDNINIKAEMIKYEYDPIRETYTSIELGNYKESFTNLKNEIKDINNNLIGMEAGFLDKAKQVATDLINSGFGGYVRVYPDRILIMDTDDEKTARRVWQWNLNGFGYSKTGINGPYGLAMTMDGSIVADFINVGILNASLIKTGVLDANLVRVAFNNIGDAIEIAANALTVYNGTARLMQLNRNGQTFWNNATQLGRMGTAGRLNINGSANNGADKTGKALFLTLDSAEFMQFGNDLGDGILINKNREINSYAQQGWVHGGLFHATKLSADTLNVLGAKNAIHPTRDGARATPAYELAESYLGDIGTDNTGKLKCVKVNIETIFGDTVNTLEYDYQVFTQAYGKGSIWVSERQADYFIVESDVENLEFAWEIKAKRRGFETDRLVPYDMTNEQMEKAWKGES